MASLSHHSVRSRLCLTLLAVSVGLAAPSASAQAPATPPELVAAYDDLATVILAVKKSEESLVRSILATTYAHASAALERANRALESGDMLRAGAALEEVAGFVAQLGTEGDNAVAGVRKRLLEGGHHHNAAGESQGIYDPGFVVVTKAVKQQLLTISRAVGQLANAPDNLDKAAIAREWKKVDDIWAKLKEH